MEKKVTGPPPHLVEHHLLLESWGGRPFRSRLQEQVAGPQVRGHGNNKDGRQNVWLATEPLTVRVPYKYFK